MIAARAWMVLAFALPSLSGMRLDDALSLLRRQGLTIVYSTALVKPEMHVEREPRSTTPRGVLDEILAPHALRAIDGRHGELLIVAAPPPPPPTRLQPPPPKARFDDEIVVMPSRTRVVGEPATASASLSGAELRGVPNPSDDVPRAVQHFPGVTGTEASASVNIRGGNADETMIAIDGFELSEPFHLKDFFNIFSTLDASAIGRVDLMTGAFPAEWGDRMGGVIDMSLLAPPDSESSSLTVGTLSGSVSSSGATANRETTWLVSGRGWYPDVVLNADQDRTELINTDCYDILGKIEHRFTARTTASLTFLGAYDNLGYRNQNLDGIDRSDAEETSSHVWLTAETKLSDTTSMRTILAMGRLWRDRVGSISGSDLLQINDSRGFNFVELKQDWRASLGKQAWRFGFDTKTADARYDYTRVADGSAPVDTHIRPHEQTAAIYASDRIPIGNSAVAELGLRWDHQSLRGDSQLSPRMNLLWNVTPNSDLRLGWGRFYQSQRLNELQVEDGVTELAAPELAEHRTLSFEHRFNDGLALRIEAFDKPMSAVRAHFENALNPIDVFPQAQEDRVKVAPSRSRARGVEFQLTRSADGRAAWWISYTHSRATDTIDGRSVPRSWDQPNAAGGGLSLQLPRGWSASFTAAYHTGWPTTPTTAVSTANGLDVALGPRNSERLPSWFRLDGRISKSIRTRRGALSLSLDVLNLTNHENVCCVSDSVAYVRSDGTLAVTRENRSLVPVFPSLSARWRF